NQTWDFEAELTNRTTHPINGSIVLARISWILYQPFDCPEFDALLVCRNIGHHCRVAPFIEVSGAVIGGRWSPGTALEVICWGGRFSTASRSLPIAQSQYSSVARGRCPSTRSRMRQKLLHLSHRGFSTGK